MIRIRTARFGRMRGSVTLFHLTKFTVNSCVFKAHFTYWWNHPGYIPLLLISEQLFSSSPFNHYWNLASTNCLARPGKLSAGELITIISRGVQKRCSLFRLYIIRVRRSIQTIRHIPTLVLSTNKPTIPSKQH